MSENPLKFGMVCVFVKLALCYIFQRVSFFCRVRRPDSNAHPVARLADHTVGDYGEAGQHHVSSIWNDYSRFK